MNRPKTPNPSSLGLRLHQPDPPRLVRPESFHPGYPPDTNRKSQRNYLGAVSQISTLSFSSVHLARYPGALHNRHDRLRGHGNKHPPIAFVPFLGTNHLAGKISGDGNHQAAYPWRIRDYLSSACHLLHVPSFWEFYRCIHDERRLLQGYPWGDQRRSLCQRSWV